MPPYAFRWLGGVLFVMVVLSAGYLRFADYDRHHLPFDDQDSDHVHELQGRFVVVLEESPVRKSRSFSATACMLAINDTSRQRVQPVEALLVVYFAPDSSLNHLHRGDTLLLAGTFRGNAPPANPESFDYGRYLRRKGIHGTIYLPSGSWKRMGEGDQSGIFAIAESIRKTIRQKITASALSESNKGLALALLIGIKDDLDPETNRSFTAAGAVHVLCVSGLHVGVVFIMVSLLFGFLKHLKRYGRLLFFLFGVGSIWGYAMITGLPPSVNRASLMFSFMMAGNLMRRKTPSMNGVLASAFILLMDEPPVIFHTGFQLSYLAVTGIITLHPVISQLWAPRWKLMVKVRDLISVSLCAQLFTFPVAVSLFSVFPNYFLLTNLLVIPVTGLVVYAGAVFLVVPYATFAGTTTWIFNTFLSVMQWLVGFVDALPGSLSENLLLGNDTMWLLLLAIFALTVFLNGEGKGWFFLALISVVVVTGMGFFNRLSSAQQPQMVIYQVRKSVVADFVADGKRITVSGSDTIPEKDLQFAVSGFRLKCGVAGDASLAGNIVLNNTASVRVQHPAGEVLFLNTVPMPEHDIATPLVVVLGPSLVPSDEIPDRVRADVWILDERMPVWKRDAWKTLLHDKGLEHWDIHQDGAWLL